MALTIASVACLDAAYKELADTVGRSSPKPPKRTGRENSLCSREEMSHPNIAGRKDDSRDFSSSANSEQQSGTTQWRNIHSRCGVFTSALYALGAGI